MNYYFILPAARTLIILTILANVCLFLIISRPESCFNVHLPLWSQFSCSLTPTRLCLYSSNTSLFEFTFFLTPACHSAIFLFSAVFFYRRKFSEFCCIHLKFSLPFQIPYVPSFHFHCLYSTCSIGHPPHSSASPVDSGKKKEVRVKGVLKSVRP